MDENLFNLLSCIISIISLVITAGGLIAVYTQIRKIRETSWSTTHTALTNQSFELLKFFSQYPNTYDYFYNRKKLDDNAPDKIIILYAAEALANFMEHLILQKKNLPLQQWQVWERFILTTFKSSILLRDFLQENRAWYSLELLAIADECNLRYND